MFLCGFFCVFLFLDPRRGRFTCNCSFSGTTQQGREGKSAPPKRRVKKQHHPLWVVVFSLSPIDAAWTSSSFGLRRFLPCALWAGAAFLCPRLGGAAWPPPPFDCAAFLLLFWVAPRKKAAAQRAHGRKHYPDEGEAMQPHLPGSGEEGSTTQKEREKSNTTQSGWWCFPPSPLVLLRQPFVGGAAEHFKKNKKIKCLVVAPPLFFGCGASPFFGCGASLFFWLWRPSLFFWLWRLIFLVVAPHFFLVVAPPFFFWWFSPFFWLWRPFFFLVVALFFFVWLWRPSFSVQKVRFPKMRSAFLVFSF